jgi:hypothetical protein
MGSHNLSMLWKTFPGATFHFYGIHVTDLALDDVPVKSGHAY